MANWAYTNYVIEGPKETLKKIHNALLNPTLDEGASDGWEGGVLKTLSPKWTEKEKYLRGFIQQDTVNLGEVLSFDAEEAWGLTDFNEELNKIFPDIKIYYNVEEFTDDVWATNDKEGKYFTGRFYADCCIDGEYYSDYFVHKSDMFKWLYEKTGDKVNSEWKVEEFNDTAEEDDFINIYGCDVIE